MPVGCAAAAALPEHADTLPLVPAPAAESIDTPPLPLLPPSTTSPPQPLSLSPPRMEAAPPVAPDAEALPAHMLTEPPTASQPLIDVPPATARTDAPHTSALPAPASTTMLPRACESVVVPPVLPDASITCPELALHDAPVPICTEPLCAAAVESDVAITMSPPLSRLTQPPDS